MSFRSAVDSDRPYLLNLRKGARAAVVVPLVLAFCQFVLGNSAIALFAVFAATAALVFADYGGPPLPRAGAYVTMLLVGVAMVLLGAALSAHPVAAVAGMFAVAFGVTLASSLGEYAPLHVSPIALAYSLSVLEPLSQVSLLDRLAGWTLGSLAALAGALLLWPIVARTGLRDDAAELCRSLAAALSDQSGDPAGTARQLAELSEELHRSSSTRMRPAGGAAHDIALFKTVVHLQQATTLVTRSLGAGTDHPPGADGDASGAVPDLGEAELRRCVAAALQRTAAVIQRAPPPSDTSAEPQHLAMALADGRERVRNAAATVEPPARALGLQRDTVALRALAHLCIWIEVEAARSTGNNHLPAAADGAPDPAVLEIAPEVADSVPADDAGSRLRRTRRVLGREVGYRSVVLKNSVRAGIALASAVALAEVLGVEHGFWVVLATLLVLRSDAYSTSANGLAAVVGTIGGFAASIGVLELAGDHKAALWVVFVLAVFLSGYTPGTFGTAMGQGSFALLVVMLLTITDAPGVATAVVRLEDVALGAATAVLLSLVIWPRGARTIVASSVAGAFRAASQATAVFVDRPPAECRAAEERLSAARRNADDALDAAMTEHGGQVVLGAWMSLLRVVETARALTFGLVPPARVCDPDGPCARSVEPLRGQAADLGNRFAKFADALESADRSALASAPPEEGTTAHHGEGLLACLELRRSQAAAESAPPGDPAVDPMYDPVILSAWSWFIEEMGRDLDEATPQVLELAAAADRRSWLFGVRK